MQHELVNNGLNCAVSTNGMHTPDPDYPSRSAETVSTHSTARISYPSHPTDRFPPSTASDHCEQSNTSEPEKSEYGHQLPANSPPTPQEVQQNGVVCGNNNNNQNHVRNLDYDPLRGQKQKSEAAHLSTPVNSRARSGNSTVPPPRLRRDTDSKDAIVKMIVIFCTNLIRFIWPVDSVSTASTCGTGSQLGGSALPLQVFITETLKRSKMSYSTLQIAMFYLILLKQRLPGLASPGRSSQPDCRAMSCGRRMFLIALILASKYLQDQNYDARAWSKISGLPMKEINDNERRYLRFVGWNLHVPKEAFENWSKIVLAICRLSAGQDPGCKDSDHPPRPDAGCVPQTNKQTQPLNMCSDSWLYIVKRWWILNLKSLCTDVVRSPKRVEEYLASIPQLRIASTLPRPLLENKLSKRNAHKETLPSTRGLSKPI